MPSAPAPWANTDTGDLPAGNQSKLPVLQWSHDQAGLIGEISKWEMLGVGLPFEIVDVVFKRPQRHKEKCYYSNDMEFCVLAYTVTWERGQGDDRRRVKDYEQGAHSRLRILALLKAAPEVGPVVITFKSTAARDVKEALKNYTREIVAVASSAAKRPMPLCIFWLQVKAGVPQSFDEGGEACPPVLVLPAAAQQRVWMEEHWIGDEVMALARGHAQLVNSWQRQREDRPEGRDPEEVGAPEGDGGLDEARELGESVGAKGRPWCMIHKVALAKAKKPGPGGQDIWGHGLNRYQWCDGVRIHTVQPPPHVVD